MARLTQLDFESNSITAGVEFDSVTGSPTISSTTVRSGSYAFNSSVSATTAYLTHQYAAVGSTADTHTRIYLNFASFPTANGIAIWLIRSAAAGNNIVLRADTNGALSITDEQAASAQVGSKTPALKLSTWYRVEISYTYSTGKVFANWAIGDAPAASFAVGSATASIESTIMRLGVIDSGTANVFFDDVAINDSSGTSQANIPGPGKIIRLRPSAAGDSNGFTVGVGGTAGQANNFTRVQEVTPDDATTYNGAALLNAEDLFNCDNFTGGAFTAISVVAVGLRMADLVAGDATTGVKAEIEKTGSGTKSQSATLVPNSTSFKTNAAAVPLNYPLVTYNDPDGNPWGQSTLDSMQIGYINSAVGVQTIAISTVWASVDYAPALVGGTTTSTSSTSTSSTSTSSTSSSTSTSSTSTSSTSISTSSTSKSTSTSSTSISMSITTVSTSSTSSSTSSTSTSSTSTSTSVSSTSSSTSSTSTSSTSTSSTSSSTSFSSTSTSFSSTSSSISSTSASTSSTSISTSSTSSSTSTTTILSNMTYSYEDRAPFTVVQDFTYTTTWVCPANTTSLQIECWGGGGGGGGGDSGATTTGGTGGGGGAYSKETALSVTAGTSYTVTVGANGTGGPVDGVATAGGDSWFSTSGTVLAKGGGGGTRNNGAVGTGGAAGSGVGDVKTSGGNGGSASTPGGGGGGGAGGDNGSGGVGGNASSGVGGTAGVRAPTISGNGGAGTGNNSNGNPGTTIGGGGGGTGQQTGIGGAGAGGFVRLTYTTVTPPPSGGTNLINIMTGLQVGDLGGDDGDYLISTGSEFVIQEYKKQWTNNSDSPTFTWRGRTTFDTTVSPMYLQIYNVNSSAWETLDTETLRPADVDFVMSGTQTSNASNYYDSRLIVTFRIYQRII